MAEKIELGCRMIVESSGYIVVKDGEVVVYEGKNTTQAAMIYDSLLAREIED